jgi:hypothetical protein
MALRWCAAGGLYDAEGVQFGNSLNRLAIGDRDDVWLNSAGSVETYLQHETQQWHIQPASRIAG